MWASIEALFTNQVSELAVSLVIVAAQIGVLSLLGYMRPNVRYVQRRVDGSPRSNLFIKNLHSHRYKRSMKVLVRADGVSKIEDLDVHGGPWCKRVVRTAHQPGQDDTALVEIDGVPEDAVFGIRAICKHPIRLDFAPDSEIRGSRFKRPLPSFDRRSRRWMYYAVRFVLGVAGFVLVQLGARLVADEKVSDSRLEMFDVLVSTGIGLALAVGIFVLVVPTTGKSIILGYLDNRAETFVDLRQPAPPAATVTPPVRRLRWFTNRVSS